MFKDENYPLPFFIKVVVVIMENVGEKQYKCLHLTMSLECLQLHSPRQDCIFFVKTR